MIYRKKERKEGRKEDKEGRKKERNIDSEHSCSYYSSALPYEPHPHHFVLLVPCQTGSHFSPVSDHNIPSSFSHVTGITGMFCHSWLFL
jgi:hypothetical protein